MTELEILDDDALARRWYKDQQEGVTPEAIARWLDRITNRKRAGHLKSFKSGNKRLYRIEDVKAYEARAKNSMLSLVQRYAEKNDATEYIEGLMFAVDLGLLDDPPRFLD